MYKLSSTQWRKTGHNKAPARARRRGHIALLQRSLCVLLYCVVRAHSVLSNQGWLREPPGSLRAHTVEQTAPRVGSAGPLGSPSDDDGRLRRPPRGPPRPLEGLCRSLGLLPRDAPTAVRVAAAGWLSQARSPRWRTGRCFRTPPPTDPGDLSRRRPEPSRVCRPCRERLAGLTWTHWSPARFLVGGGSGRATSDAAGMSSHLCRRPLGPNFLGAVRFNDRVLGEH